MRKREGSRVDLWPVPQQSDSGTVRLFQPEIYLGCVRYEYWIENYLGFLHLACILILLRCF